MTATIADGQHLLAGIARPIEQVLASMKEVAAAMTAITAGRTPLRRSDLGDLRVLVLDVLHRHQGFAAGAGVVLAPGVLADAPRWIDWWWADQGAGAGRLDVDLDPESAEFYDYTTTEWYREPARTGRPSVAGPYVDYICTHAYTFTLSVPVTDGSTFLGVAGADILAGEVERMALPALSRLGGAAVLASGSGRVIASTTTALLPGVVMDSPEPGSMCRLPGPLPWMLLALDEHAAAG